MSSSPAVEGPTLHLVRDDTPNLRAFAFFHIPSYTQLCKSRLKTISLADHSYLCPYAVVRRQHGASHRLPLQASTVLKWSC